MGAPSRDNWNELTRAASICMRAAAIRLLGPNADTNDEYYNTPGCAASRLIAEEAEQPPPPPTPLAKPKVV